MASNANTATGTAVNAPPPSESGKSGSKHFLSAESGSKLGSGTSVAHHGGKASAINYADSAANGDIGEASVAFQTKNKLCRGINHPIISNFLVTYFTYES